MTLAVEERIIHSRTLGFAIRAKVYEDRVHFTIYEIMGWVEGESADRYDRAIYRRIDTGGVSALVDTLQDAAPYLHGEVKWDGCANWHFDEQDRGMLHSCGRADLQRLGEIMVFCWDLAAKMCPKWIDKAIDKSVGIPDPTSDMGK